MVKNKRNIGTSWEEMFDLERLDEIAKLVQRGRCVDGSFSDFECHVWALMRDLQEGIEVK